MKKILCIFFSVVYLLSSVGVYANLHYCGGKLVSISFSSPDEGTCCGKKMTKMNCCKEKSLVYKVKDVQDAGGAFSLINPGKYSALPAFSINSLIASYIPRVFSVPGFHSPPDVSCPPTYLFISVFRI